MLPDFLPAQREKGKEFGKGIVVQAEAVEDGQKQSKFVDTF